MSSVVGRKAESEHEVTETPRNNTVTALLGNEADITLHNPGTPKNPQTRDFLRHSRLQILGELFTKLLSRRNEPRKIAMYRRRQVAAFHCLPHLAPLSGALTLLSLRWKEYWIGPNPPDPTTLQFVAKFHEILMQVSILEILLCIIRIEAARGFISLGALSGAIQPTQLSYLWSLDFLSVFSSKSFHGRGWRQIMIGTAIPVLIISTALVGPSSAVLMIPRQGCPSPTVYDWIRYGPIDTVFSTQKLELNWTGVLEPRLESRMFAKTGDPEDEYRYTSLHNFDRVMYSYSHDHWFDSTTLLQKFGEKVTISTDFADRTLHNAAIRSREQRNKLGDNVTMSISLPQPITDVFCTRPNLHTNWRSSLNETIQYVQGDGTSLGSLGNMSSLAGRFEGRGVVGNWVGDWHRRTFDPVWLMSPESNSQSLLGIFFAVESHSNATELLPLDLMLTETELLRAEYSICSLTAYWDTAESSLVFNEMMDQPTRSPRVSELKETNRRNITLNAANMTLNPNDPEMMWGGFMNIGFENLPTNLAMMLAVAISETSNLAQSKVNFANQSATFMDGLSKAAVRSIWYGYGYCADSTSIRLSLAVILAYCIITVAYLSYILISGETSTAWNSAIELVVLALQSKKPDYPGQGHTGVGIDSLDTFRQGVGIRVNNDNELELVFANDRDIEKRGLRKIERNTAY
ncbi:hypothetical protein FB567DRAFT_51523 [Paraphoma chrysanthemicola]|uniref:Uncharacterized protein n=1 Tax=Paraphoma chrysanthemicola TaxID=798071 RepID=A0A8K0R5L7_9PLEO|nr:hypothetical protein FB567DRAFT_51523 [Paraphoma chrysanthemicola]